MNAVFNYFGLSIMTGASLSACAESSGKIRMPEKPNLLFIWTDQQVDKTLAVYGNDIYEVPNLNRLADESIVFANNRVVQPVSTPSRGTVMTGLYPHQHGAWRNNAPLNPESKTIPELLGDPAYATGYFGKWHLGDEIFAQHGFREFDSVEDHYIDHYSEGRDRSDRSGYHHFLISRGVEPDNKKAGIFSRKFVSSLPYELGKPKYLEMKAVDFLERHQSEPFVLYINYLEPHTPFNGPFNEFHDRESLPLSPSIDVPLGDDDPVRYRIKQLNSWTYDNFKTARQRYAGLCHAVDKSVGTILRCLDSLGLRDNTIVVFTSDHGEMMGAHRLMHKSVMYEEALRVPLMFRIPWLNANRQQIVSRSVTSIDIVPTVLELMGAPEKDGLAGQSLVPLMKNKKRKNDDGYTVMMWNPGNIEKENYPKGKEFSQEQILYYDKASYRTIVSPDNWKLSVSDRDKHQLFDLNNDPYEYYNLYYKGTHDARIKTMERKLRDWQQRVGDRMEWE